MTAKCNEIRLWLMEVDAAPPALLAHWRACLNAQELARADRFYFDADREIYLAAHWLLRQALSHAAPLAPEAWQFASEQFGKPRIAPGLGYGSLKFNLSHTRGFVACAVGYDAEIGVDVERIAPKHASLDIAERYFSASEVALMRAAPAADRAMIFFRLWTLKEALIKATGEGLSRALDSFSFAFAPTAITFHPSDPSEAARWMFLEDRPTPHHALALAIRSGAAGGAVSVSRVSVEPGEMNVLDRSAR
ncbi:MULTISPECIES: 4'-phosphopantetheinyl transferase family protein [unclassified Bradyrhizobium]|uniref:4'-phosphopantetheinyl transferase family protein n=1 Tax=unclassified Bradyrhizobium TaxID=2631580 RepID=UPI002916564E|nr:MULTISPECIES: 4'-phosphopantetheinyl transferase superfamily protein [unclassified Bradyrhizobium]